MGPGNFAALGSLISDVKQDFVRTRTLLPRRLGSFAEIADGLDRLEEEARRSLGEEGVAPGDFSSRRALGMRYLGQSWEVDVEVPPGDGHRGGRWRPPSTTPTNGGSGTATTARPRW